MNMHTPGEWKRTGFTVYATEGERGKDANRFYAAVSPGHINGVRTTEDELLANARLIAAAPDLLEAVVELLATHLASIRSVSETIDNRTDAAIRLARAAIAKAEGNS